MAESKKKQFLGSISRPFRKARLKARDKSVSQCETLLQVAYTCNSLAAEQPGDKDGKHSAFFSHFTKAAEKADQIVSAAEPADLVAKEVAAAQHNEQRERYNPIYFPRYNRINDLFE